MTRATPLPFWMVYGVGQGAPTVRHKSEDSALAEAKRLARKNPDVEFVVLASTMVVVKRDVDVHRLQTGSWPSPLFEVDDNTPF